MSAPLMILYVDDDDDIRTVATMSLAIDPDLTVHAAASGEEALDLLEQATWRPDVILLDVMMPGIDGPELARRIQAKPELANVPLMFMTARARQLDIDAYLAMGAIAVIAKPFDPMELASRVRRALAGRIRN